MALATWTDGGADGDWTNADNWSGGSGAGGIPANGDSVLINTSSRDIDGLATGLTGITLYLGSGHTGQIGDGVTYLDIDCVLIQIDKTNGDVYLTGAHTLVVVQNTSPTQTAVNWKASTDSDIGTLRILGGMGLITVGSNAILDDVEMIGAHQVSLLIDDNVTSLDTVLFVTGQLELNAAVGTSVEARGGGLTIGGAATIASLIIEANGRVAYNSSGTISSLMLYGVFDGRQNPNPVVVVSECETFERSHLLLRNGVTAWSFTGGILVQGDTRMDLAPGTTISLS